MAKEARPSLDDVIKKINKEAGSNIVGYGIPKREYTRIPFTSPRMNYCTYGGIPTGRIVEFYGEEGGGKALVNGTPVLSEYGWVNIEKLNIGDKVYGEDGKLHHVVGVYPQGEKECYSVKLRDGTSVDCSGDHLWSVFTGGQIQHLRNRDCKPFVKTTVDIMNTLKKGYYLPSISSIEYPDNMRRELLLDPYLMGLLLGDGSVGGGTPSISNTEQDIIDDVRSIVSEYGCKVVKYCDANYSWGIPENKKSNNHPINSAFRYYGLFRKGSREKFIPEDYKYASEWDRYRIIAGLINTDGNVWRCVDYTSTSDRLVDDFWEICMSLGIYCVKKHYKVGGRVRIPDASVTPELISLLSEKHRHKYDKYMSSRKQNIHIHRRKIVDVIQIGMRECTCIKVDNPTSLFITKDFIPTHNTTSALDIVGNYQRMQANEEHPKKVVYFDNENTLDVLWAAKLGVDVDSLILIQPEEQNAEELLEDVLDMMRTGEVGLAVIDSIAVLVSAQAMDKTVADKTYAGISMALTTFGNKANMLCKQHDCTVIGINQLRDDLAAMYGNATKTPGGRGWKHLCSVRLQFTKGAFIDEKGNEIKRSSESPAGNKVLMSMVKNKTCPSNRRGGYYTIDYANGIDYLADLIEVALKYDIILQKGAWFSVINPDTGEILAEKIQGMSNVREFFMDEANEPTLDFVEQYIDSKIGM